MASDYDITSKSGVLKGNGATISGSATTADLPDSSNKRYVTDAQSAWLATVSSYSTQAWPIGSVFVAVVSTNPATLLGYGTWTAIGAGRVLVGLDSGDTDFDTVEETGGAKTVAAAGTNSAPTVSGSTASESSHTHSVTTNVAVDSHTTTNKVPTTGAATGLTGPTSHAVTNNPVTSGAGSAHSHGAGTLAASAPTFTGSATSVVQPYFVVYMWKRTA